MATRTTSPHPYELLNDQAAMHIVQALGALAEIHLTSTSDRWRLEQAATHLEALADILAQCRRAS